MQALVLTPILYLPTTDIYLTNQRKSDVLVRINISSAGFISVEIAMDLQAGKIDQLRQEAAQFFQHRQSEPMSPETGSHAHKSVETPMSLQS